MKHNCIIMSPTETKQQKGTRRKETKKKATHKNTQKEREDDAADDRLSSENGVTKPDVALAMQEADPGEKTLAIPGKRCPRGTKRKGKWCVPHKQTGRPKIQIADLNANEEKVPSEPVLVLPEREDETARPTKKSAMNLFLEEKESHERKHPLETHDYLYPDLNDADFNLKIAQKKEFQDAQYDGRIFDIAKQADMLCNAKFELSPHQVFVRNFLSSQTPYKGLLLYHGLGTGKTCSAIGVAEETRRYMKQVGLKQQVIVVASPNVQDNFRLQLFDERKLVKVRNAGNEHEYTWNIESCVGNSLINEINPNSMRNLSREKVKSNIQALINENYAFVGYIQFANLVRAVIGFHKDDNPELAKQREERNIRQFFDNRLIIIDEVHNIRLADDSNKKELQQVGAVLMQVVKFAHGLRLLLLSATPMFNSYTEIIWLTNLLNELDKRSHIQIADVFDANGEFKKASKPGEESGEDVLRRKLTGYISYVRGENPYTFPYRLYPAVFSPENTLPASYPAKQMNGLAIDRPIQNINVYVNRVSADSYQMRTYLAIIDYLRWKTRNGNREMPDFDNMESFGYTMLQRPLESLNIVYPDEELTAALRVQDADKRALHYSDDLFQRAVGGTGLARIVQFATTENDEPLKHDYEYNAGVMKSHGRIFSPTELPKYSAKMAEICNAIRSSEGIVLIYSQYIDGGVVPMALALEEMGFSRYSHALAGRHRHLFKHAPTQPVDALTMLPRAEMSAGIEFRPAQYIMITGDKGLSPSNAEDVKYATNRDNMDGSKVKVIIISKAGSEGLDFKAIRQVHILEPWFNMNRIEQIIGRGVRNLSHCALPFAKRNVQIYLHGTVIDGADEEAADLYLYRLAERKAAQIGKVTRLLKESAADCILNFGQSNFTAEKLSKLVANQNIRLQLSTKDPATKEAREVQFRIGDLDGSEICDYMSCEYQCRPKTSRRHPQPLDHTDQSTYSESHLQSNIYYIIGRIKALYRENHAYTLEQIREAINAVRVYPIQQIYYVLSLFVNDRNMVLFDKYGRFGYLINRKKYYEFQPIEITDERASILERSVPVEYKRDNIVLELPKERTGDIDPAVEKAADEEKEGKQDDTDDEDDVSKPGRVFIPVPYDQIIRDIADSLALAKTPQPIKSTETNWYKNASRIIEHIKYTYGLPETQITKYIVYHFLDAANYVTKRSAFEGVFDKKVFGLSPEIETHVSSYFRDLLMKSKRTGSQGIFIANREDAQLLVFNEDESSKWREADSFELSDFAEEYEKKYVLDKRKLNAIVGYMIQFKDQDMAFYYKDIALQRNKKGRRCERAGGKMPIVETLNRVVQSDDGDNIYNETNVDSMYSGSLCVVLEMVLRGFNDARHKGQIYYMTPEQAIRNRITDYTKSGK